jgi:hypothetical protein
MPSCWTSGEDPQNHPPLPEEHPRFRQNLPPTHQRLQDLPTLVPSQIVLTATFNLIKSWISSQRTATWT